METLKDITLTSEQQELLCSIINVFGTGQHPYADDKSLPYFTSEYIKEILETEEFVNAQDNLTDTGKRVLAEIKELLN